MDVENLLQCPFSTLMAFWGETFFLPMDENGVRKQAAMSDHVHSLDQTVASRED